MVHIEWPVVLTSFQWSNIIDRLVHYEAAELNDDGRIEEISQNFESSVTEIWAKLIRMEHTVIDIGDEIQGELRMIKFGVKDKETLSRTRRMMYGGKPWIGQTESKI